VRVTEIFHSIQGESTLAGEKCTFVRFTGCDLRCGYCDTEYAFYGGKAMTRAEIHAEVDRLGAKFVCLTGGEPTLQKELPELAQELLDRGYTVSLETHGQRPLDKIPRGVRKIVDLKTPGSKEQHTDFSPLASLGSGDELKVVVCSQSDFQWSVDVIDKLALWNKVPVLFSPAWGEVQPKDLADWILASGRPARMQLQLHKIIWGSETRGV
jgi:7-carboxy-7-deazaguanine synthase